MWRWGGYHLDELTIKKKLKIVERNKRISSLRLSFYENKDIKSALRLLSVMDFYKTYGIIAYFYDLKLILKEKC